MTEPILANTATKLHGAAGKVVVCGSHGGAYAGLIAAAAGVRAILLNDAGRGLNDAGVKGLAVLEEHGIAAATLSHAKSRIGDAADGYARGIVSAANGLAEALGVEAGIAAKAAAKLLEDAVTPRSRPEVGEEHRMCDVSGARPLVIVDSISLVRAGEDDGAIVVSASHGGLVGGDPRTAGVADAFLYAYNDAGIGCEEAGVSRLPALEARGIAAVCVDCFSAEIGIGPSTYETGVISRLNAAAAALGAEPGAPLKGFIDSLR